MSRNLYNTYGENCLANLSQQLFDFDLEVQPILEVLVGKVTEQALIEVMEEEELASLRQRQKIFEEMREAELQEQQRLEEVERRRKHEKVMIPKLLTDFFYLCLFCLKINWLKYWFYFSIFQIVL